MEYGLQIGQAIQYEWFRRDNGFLVGFTVNVFQPNLDFMLVVNSRLLNIKK